MKIKYRAFDPLHKIMHENVVIVDGKALRRGFVATDICSDLSDRLIPMRMYGERDKNLKEIYEGDIISLVNADGETIMVVCEYGVATRYIVGANECVNECDIEGFYFKLPNGKKSFPIVNNYAGKHDLELFEVIGNIYENENFIK